MYNLQEEVDDTLKEMIIKAVDEQYINSLYKEYVGYEDEDVKLILNTSKIHGERSPPSKKVEP